MKAHFLKIGLLCGFLLAIFSLAQAQAPYLGGIGDGYASGEAIAFVEWDPEDLDSVAVFPTVFSAGTYLNVSVRDVKSRLMVVVLDAQGRVVSQSYQWDVNGSTVMAVSTEGWAEGTYLIEVRRDTRSETRKVVVQK